MKKSKSHVTNLPGEEGKETKVGQLPMTKGVKSDSIDSALRVMASQATRTVSEDSKVMKVSYPKELVGVLRTMFHSGKEYDFLMSQTSNNTGITTDSGGSFDTAYSWSPAVKTYGEWSSLADLFDEVKAVKNEFYLVTTFSGSSTAKTACIMIGPDYNNIAVTPSGGLVARLPEMRVLHNINGFKAFRIVANIKRAQPFRLWAATSSPAEAEPVGGCVGQWSISSADTGANSLKYFETRMRMHVKLRNRA